MNPVPHVLESLGQAAPLLVLLAAALAVLIADAVRRPGGGEWLAGVAAGGCVVALLTLPLAGWPAEGARTYFFGALAASRAVAQAQTVILGATLFVALISPRYLRDRAISPAEYYALLLLAAAGTIALAASAELLALFLNLELVSIPLYILTGLERRNAASSEAAFKYFLLGSLAAAFLLFGIAFVFGATGQTLFAEIGRAIASGAVLQPLFLALGFGMIFAGLAFKLTLAPFHMYAPDVYEGAPTPITALIATASKVGGFAALFSVVALTRGMTEHLVPLRATLWALAAAGMVVGNAGAVVQPRFKRMMAYSSIAHSAYIMIPIVVLAARPDLAAPASAAMNFALLAYTVMTLLAFGAAAALGPAGEGDIVEMRGLGRRAPWLAGALTLALVSLVGIPPTIGFFGKFQLFSLAVRAGQLPLAILGVLASVASAFYYLRVVVTIYMSESDEAAPAPSGPDRAGAVALALGSVGLFALIFVAGA